MRFPLIPLLFVAFLPPAGAAEKEKAGLQYRVGGSGEVAKVLVGRVGGPTLVTMNAPKEGRSYLHPLLAPDGKGELTEQSPGHHKHQTGLFVGFVKVNDRDFFHNRGPDYFRMAGGVYANGGGKEVVWAVDYFLLDGSGKPLLREVQRWTMRDEGSYYTLDLDWRGKAEQDVTFGKYDYGGLFLRMPWREKGGGKAVNSAGQVNEKAEGQKADWVDVGMPIEGRPDWGHVAILGHRDNPGHPVPWRVDGQLGVGPAPGRAGAWKVEKDKGVRLRYRMVVYTGEMNRELVQAEYRKLNIR